MADKQTDFWLPPEFLTDDDILMDPYHFDNSVPKTLPRSNHLFPSEFSGGLCSSPVDSAVGSAENDSDEEDLLARLTRRLTLTSIEEANKSVRTQLHMEKGLEMSRSPQSTLAQMGCWTGRSSGSSNCSPNGPSLVSSPRTTPLCAETDGWDLLYQDVGHVERLRVNGGDRSVTRAHLYPDPCRTLTPGHLLKSSISGVHISPFNQVGGVQMMQQQSSEMWGRKVNDVVWPGARQLVQTRGSWVGSGHVQSVENGMCGRAALGGLAQTAAWHSLQLQLQNRYDGPNMRAVFSGRSSGSGAGNVGVKRECAGTGVFIPRRHGCQNSKSPFDSRKKTGRSSALLSAKVVNGVNKNLVGFSGLPQPQTHTCANGGLISDYDLLIARRNATMLSQRMRNLSPEVSISPELRLPHEWMY